MGRELQGGQEARLLRVQESSDERSRDADDGSGSASRERSYLSYPSYRQPHLLSRLRPRLVRDRRQALRVGGEGHLLRTVVGAVPPLRDEGSGAVLVQ